MTGWNWLTVRLQKVKSVCVVYTCRKMKRNWPLEHLRELCFVRTFALRKLRNATCAMDKLQSVFSLKILKTAISHHTIVKPSVLQKFML